MISNKKSQKVKVLRASRRVNSPKQSRNLEALPKFAQHALLYKQILPNEVGVTFKYTPTIRLNNVGLNVASRSFIMNGLYDVDPAVATTAVVGFVEWMSLYFNYRVMAVRAELEAISYDGALVACLAFHDTGFSANAYTPAYYDNVNSHPKLLPQTTGGSITKWNVKKTMSEVHGDVSPYTDDKYLGTPGSNPTENTYITVAANCVGLPAPAFVNGIIMKLTLSFDTLLSHRKSLTQ